MTVKRRDGHPPLPIRSGEYSEAVQSPARLIAIVKEVAGWDIYRASEDVQHFCKDVESKLAALDQTAPPGPCTDYRPDHNGECLNCDEWADAHTPVALLLGEIRHQYERRQRDYAEAGGDPATMQGDLTCYLPYDLLRPVFPRQRVVTKVGTPDPGPSDPETS